MLEIPQWAILSIAFLSGYGTYNLGKDLIWTLEYLWRRF